LDGRDLGDFIFVVYGSQRMTWGGARAGAGRPAKGPRPSEPHKRRPAVTSRHPVHVTSRVVAGLGTLRTRAAYRALRRALATSYARADFRVVHFAVARDRLELLIEADDKRALARGMQGLQVSAARWLNRAANRTGGVFPDRYRLKLLATRAAVRATVHALLRAPSIGANDGTPPRIWPQSLLLRHEPRLGRVRIRDPAA
jgi:putative transposase